MNQQDLTQQDWAYPSNEIDVDTSEDGVLGKGAFGIVRKASWCGSEVAVKQLHAQDLPMAGEVTGLKEEDIDALIREMSICSRLRHPNLVLFLGVTYDPLTRTPHSIVTEVLPHSLYDLLETKNIRFDSQEVLKMACDIATALTYLHERTPPVVHRDLSARNVLVDHQGRAKLSDLGQAKILGGTISHRSQNTTMPGAMAYAAPEVLTGRYSSPIDMFSFGVLVAQVCTGQFPRIDRREQQVEAAIQAVPKLGPLLSRCLQLHPEKRPTASAALEEISSLFNSDGYVGEDMGTTQRLRRTPHSFGPLAERWLRSELVRSNEKLEMELSTTEARLASELGRWRMEADGRDKAEELVVELNKKVERKTKEADDARNTAKLCREETEAQRESRIRSEAQINTLMNDISLLKATTSSLEQSVKRESEAAVVAKSASKRAEEVAKRAVEKEKSSELKCSSALDELSALRSKLSKSEEEKVELNEWLQQSINRWEKEKSNWLQERSDLKNSISTLRNATQSERIAAAKQAEELGSVRGELESLSQVSLPELLQGRCIDAERVAKEYEEENIFMRNQIDAVKSALDSAEKELFKVQQSLDDALEREQLKEKETSEAKQRVEEADFKVRSAIRDASAAREGGEAMARKLGEHVAHISELEKAQLESAAEIETLRKLVESLKATESTNQQPEEEATAVVVLSSSAPPQPPTSGSLPPISPRRSNSLGTRQLGSDPAHRVPILTSSSEKKAAVNKAFEVGGIEGLVKLMSDYGHDVDVLVRIAKTLRDKCSDEQAREDACLFAAPPAVVKAMERHPTSLALQRECLRAIGNICFAHDANRASMGESGGAWVVVRVLTNCGGDAELMAVGFTCVTNLAHHSPDNRRKLSEAGVVAAVRTGMSEFPLEPKLQRQACWALLTLAASDKIAQEILDNGGVESIVGAMVNLSGDTSVQHFGCWALANLAQGCACSNAAAIRRFRMLGAIEVLKSAVKRFPNHPEISQRGVLALKLLLPSK